MQTRIRELPLPAVAGGVVVLGGAALWQLGIEFERAWMRSYEQPLLGDRGPEDRPGTPQSAHTAEAATTFGEHRRWVKGHHPRGVPRAARGVI
jgi:hypothetical protein